MTGASDIRGSDIFGAIAALPPLRDIIRDHALRAEKSLGQNFLLDLNLTAKIARAASSLRNANVLEIGPGPGGLTRAILMESPAYLLAVEYDPRAVAALQGLQDAAQGKLQILQRDALDLRLDALPLTSPITIVANLPYNIATPLLTGWLQQNHEKPGLVCEMVLMFQKEVAQRIAAKPGTKTYGRLSIIAQWLCDCKIMFDVPAAAFTPAPKVTSSIVRLVPRPRPDGDFAAMEKITAAAFGQRRKMLRGSMKDYLPLLEACGIDPTRRAEDVSVAEYAALVRHLKRNAV